MHYRRLWIIVAAALAACGDDDGGGERGGGSAASCTHTGDYCTQLNGTLTAEQTTQVSGLCALSGGTFAAAACSTASTVPGRCAYGEAGLGIPGLTEDDYYYTASWTAPAAQADCSDLGGTWIAAGTGGTGGGATTGTCNVSGVLCTSYSGAAAAVAAEQASCTAEGDTWSTAACPNNVAFVGVCTTTSGTLSVATTYYPPIFDAASAQAECSGMSGTWWAGNTTGGNTGGTVQSFGCQPTGEPFCSDVSGSMTAETRAQYEAICTSDGTVIAACPTANRTGTCTYVMAGVSFMDRFYVAAQAAEDQAICVENGGAWTPN